MFVGSAELRRSRLKQLNAELVGGDCFHRVSGAPVQQVDGGFMPCLALGDECGARLGLFKTSNHGLDQLLGFVRVPSHLSPVNELTELVPQGLLVGSLDAVPVDWCVPSDPGRVGFLPVGLTFPAAFLCQ